MKVENLCQQDNKLHAKFSNDIEDLAMPLTTEVSPQYTISGTALFQIKLIIAPIQANEELLERDTLVFIRFIKRYEDDVLTYAIKFTSNELKIVDKNFITNDGTWQHIHTIKGQHEYFFNVTVVMSLEPSASPFATLHEDTELTDFELRSEDGSVNVHRAVLAAASPVLRRMLGGKWRESSEGHVDVAGTSKATLQKFKDYIYLHILPENGVEQLLILASYYMMQDLEQICVYKLVSGLTAENVCDLLEFAAQNKLKRLLLSILEWVKNAKVEVDEMRVHYIGTK